MNTTTNSLPKVNVGDIYVATGGYDANFADFFEITGVTAKSVKYRSIGQKVVNPVRYCGDHGMVVADKTVAGRRGTGTARLKTSYYGGVCFAVKNAIGKVAYKWDGQAISTYNYH